MDHYQVESLRPRAVRLDRSVTGPNLVGFYLADITGPRPSDAWHAMAGNLLHKSFRFSCLGTQRRSPVGRSNSCNRILASQCRCCRSTADVGWPASGYESRPLKVKPVAIRRIVLLT